MSTWFPSPHTKTHIADAAEHGLGKVVQELAHLLRLLGVLQNEGRNPIVGMQEDDEVVAVEGQAVPVYRRKTEGEITGRGEKISSLKRPPKEPQ